MVQIREGWIGSDKRRVFIVLEGMTITYMESCGRSLVCDGDRDDQHFNKIKGHKKFTRDSNTLLFVSSHGNFPPLTHLHIFA